MYRSSVEKVAAYTYGESFCLSLKLTYREKIGESLRRMEMTAVSRIYDGTEGLERCRKSASLDCRTHCYHIAVARNYLYGVCKGFTL